MNYHYTDIRTNIAPHQKERALDLARALDTSLAEVVRDALRSYLASDASEVVWMTPGQHNNVVWDIGSNQRYHRKSCHHVTGIPTFGMKRGGARAMLKRHARYASPCKVCKP